ncbi:MAG: hypothetical protein V1821_01780 [bacterium]
MDLLGSVRGAPGDALDWVWDKLLIVWGWAGEWWHAWGKRFYQVLGIIAAVLVFPILGGAVWAALESDYSRFIRAFMILIPGLLLALVVEVAKLPFVVPEQGAKALDGTTNAFGFNEKWAVFFFKAFDREVMVVLIITACLTVEALALMPVGYLATTCLLGVFAALYWVSCILVSRGAQVNAGPDSASGAPAKSGEADPKHRLQERKIERALATESVVNVAKWVVVGLMAVIVAADGFFQWDTAFGWLNDWWNRTDNVASKIAVLPAAGSGLNEKSPLMLRVEEGIKARFKVPVQSAGSGGVGTMTVDVRSKVVTMAEAIAARADPNRCLDSRTGVKLGTADCYTALAGWHVLVSETPGATTSRLVLELYHDWDKHKRVVRSEHEIPLAPLAVPLASAADPAEVSRAVLDFTERVEDSINHWYWRFGTNQLNVLEHLSYAFGSGAADNVAHREAVAALNSKPENIRRAALMRDIAEKRDQELRAKLGLSKPESPNALVSTGRWLGEVGTWWHGVNLMNLIASLAAAVIGIMMVLWFLGFKKGGKAAK